LIPLQSVKEENVSIDSVWFAGPVPMINQSNDLLVRMTNYSENKVEDVALSILYDGQNRPLGSFDIGAKSSKIDTINLFIRNTGWQEAKLTITDYPVQYDDDYRIAFNVKQDVKVLSINESGSNTYLTAAFEGLDFFGIENQSKSRLQYSGFKNFDLIVFNDLTSVSSGLTSEIKQYAENGGNVLLFLPKNLNKESYNDLLNQLKVNNIQEPDPNTNSVNSINTKDFIFANVFEKTGPNLKLPTSNSRYKMTNFQNRGEQILLKYRDGRSYLSKYPLAAGQVYICNAPLNSKDNDLVKNAEIFVPMMYKMALAKGTEDRISYVIGQDQMVESDQVSIGNESIFKVKAESEFIPGITQTGNKTLLDMQDQIKLADVYDLTLEEELMGKLAFNYDRKESDLDYYNKSDLTDKYGVRAEIIADQGADGLTEYMKVRDKGMPLWRWCILGVLLFLLLETVLLRLWKN